MTDIGRISAKLIKMRFTEEEIKEHEAKKNGYPNVLNNTKHLEVSPKSSIFVNNLNT